MSSSSLLSAAVSLIERGHCPDWATRAAIRALCRQRLRHEAQNASIERFLEICRSSPIARLPEKANEQHYEVPSEFFELVLGPHRKYSCCDWSDGATSLGEAESAALQRVCARAEVTDGMWILDLGCGWGSLTLWILQHFPEARVTSVSNSASQRRAIERRASARGHADRLAVVTADINEVVPSTDFDRVISIEMFEHVTNHETLLERISTWLCPEGKLFVHNFCHKQFGYFFESRGPADWMAEYFFSGGMMPSETLLSEYGEHLRVAKQWRVSGREYARTANAWLDNLTAGRSDAMPILERTYGSQHAKQWYHRWRLFLMACAELFAFNGGNEWFVAHHLLEKVASRANVDANVGNR